MRASEPDTEAPRSGRPEPREEAPEGPPRSRRRAGAAAPRSRRSSSRAGSSSSMLPLALLGLCAVARAAGPVLLLFIIAGLIALLLNPLVDVAAARAASRAARRWRPSSSCSSLVARPGSASCSPTPWPTRSRRSATTCPAIVDDANASLADLQAWLDDNGIDLQVYEPGQTAVETLGDRVAEGSGELVAFTRDALLRLVRGLDRADPDPRPLGLHAALRRADRRRRAPRRAARRRHAGGRLPDAGPGRRVRLRARPAAVLADHGHERGRLPVDPRRRSGSSPTARPTRSRSAPSSASRS